MSFNARREAFRNSKRRRSGLPMGAVVTTSVRGTGGGGGRFPVRTRVPRPFRAAGIKDFTFTYEPFNMTITHGTGGGINFYNRASVPSAPTTVPGGNNFQFNFSLQSMELNINGSTGGALANAGNLNFADYTALFDSYRIRKVQLQMVYNADSQSQTMTTGLPNLMMVNDYDDSQATTVASLLQYDSWKLVQMGSGANNSKYWTVVPRTQVAVETTAGSVTSISGGSKNWIDCATPNAKYFGVKGLVDTQVTGGALSNVGFVTFYVKVFVQFKNTR